MLVNIGQGPSTEYSSIPSPSTPKKYKILKRGSLEGMGGYLYSASAGIRVNGHRHALVDSCGRALSLWFTTHHTTHPFSDLPVTYPFICLAGDIGRGLEFLCIIAEKINFELSFKRHFRDESSKICSAN